MHRSARLAALVLLPCAAASHAEVTEAPDEALVVVTATRFPYRLSDLPVGVSVISRQQIATSPATTLPELLGLQAGLHTRDNAGSRDRQIDLRGFGITGDQNTLILLDGQRINENDIAPAHLSGIPLESIERIEIMRGSGAVPYGPGAGGGTINIVTRGARPGARAASAALTRGSYGLLEGRASLDVAGEQMGLSLSGSRADADNYRRNNASRDTNFAADLRLFGERSSANLKLFADRQDLRLPGARSEAQLATDRRGTGTPQDFSRTEGEHLQLAVRHRLPQAEFALDLGGRWRQTTAAFVSLGSVTDTDAESLYVSPRLRTDLNLLGVPNTLSAGLDLIDSDYRTRRSGFFGANNDAAQRNLGVYVQDTLQFAGGTRVSLGARHQRTRDTLSRNLSAQRSERSYALSAWEAALRHAFTPEFAAFAKAGRSFRFATADDNAFTASGELLQPQTSRDLEMGAELQAAGASLRLTAYRMELRNEIRFDPQTFFNANLDPTLRRGIEIDARWQALPELELSAAGALVRAEFDGGAFAGKEIPLVPRSSATLGANWRPLQPLLLSVAWRYVGRQRYDGDEANTFRRMPAYDLLDARVSYKLGGWTLSALASNLLDEKYYSYAFAFGGSFSAYPQAERNFALTAGYALR